MSERDAVQDQLTTGLPAAMKMFLTILTNGVLATFGAIANYLYTHANKGRDMRILPFMITAFLGLFIGNVVGNFIPPDFAYRDGTLLVAGFACYPLLRTFEKAFPELIMNRITALVGVSVKTSPDQPDSSDEEQDEIRPQNRRRDVVTINDEG
jgi:uncharacterized membrane protein YfcA